MGEAWRGPLEKIDEFRWRIPQSYDRGMRVPGLVFASEKLLKDIGHDQALQQVANVAHLPGIVTASLAMPDIHWGYGFPIGGVAATDPKQGGVVSPGGVGFDINCLSGDAKVLHRFGYYREIGDIVENKLSDPVRCYTLQEPERESAPITAGFRKRPSAPIYEVTTGTGRTIKATSDHPFLTPLGMRNLGELAVGDRVAVDPFEGVAYEEPTKEMLVDQEDVVRFLWDSGKERGNVVQQVLRILHERGLLPLTLRSPALPVLIKALGFLMGDGTLYFLNVQGKGIAWFFGQPENLEEIRKDLQDWFTCSRVYERRRPHKIETDYGVVEFEATNAAFRVSSTAFVTLLALLGCPVGNKSIQDYEVPSWLFRAPRWQQRLFLAAYFGAELQGPRAYTTRNRNFPCPLLTVQKVEAYAESGRHFLLQIAKLCEGFGVKTLGIDDRREKVRRKHGVSRRMRLAFSSRPEHLRALYCRIGFEYNRAHRAEAAVVSAYQASKQAVWSKRQALLQEIMRFRQDFGYGARQILAELVAMPALAGVSINRRFVERTIYGGEQRTVRVFEGFKSYPEFRRRAVDGLTDSGLVWEEIREMNERDNVPHVYDITVAHPDHNFVANGFVIHNCGVRMVKTDLMEDEVRPKLKTLIATLFNTIPCGVGMSGDIRFSQADAPRVMTQGSRWAVQRGYGTQDDLEHTESFGCIDGADPEIVSERAVQRGQSQLGTLGSGNHFLEVQAVETVFNPTLGDAFGLQPGQVTIMLHSGSRGFGYQICEDSLDDMGQAMHKYGIRVPDRQLACTPVDSPEGQQYLGAIRCAANFAWANRQCLMHLARQAFERVFEQSWEKLGMHLIYDVAHNIAKFERYTVEGKERMLCVHRKGATRAFPPGHPEVPADYRDVGQPVIIPGDMGRHSYLLVGTQRAMEESFGTVCHGAGRVMSRSQAVKHAAGRSIEQELEKQGIIVMGRGRKGIAEEQPMAYKDVNDVVHVVAGAGLAKKVCRLRPLGVIKG